MKHLRILLALVIALSIMADCSSVQSPKDIQGGSITGVTLLHTDPGNYYPFTVRVDKPHDPIGIDVRGKLVSGSVTVQMIDAAGRAIWQEQIDTLGPYTINTIVGPAQAGEYRIGMEWTGPVELQYSLRWKPGEVAIPVVSPIAMIGGIGMILVALTYIIYALRHGSAWNYLGLGALGWTATVALKFAVALAANTPIYSLLTGSLPEWAALTIFDVYVGALTGIFEVGIVWLVLRYSRLGQAAWRKVLAFGIGFGAVEALLLGISSLASVIAGMTMAGELDFDVLEAIARANNVLYSLAPIAERLALVMIHLFANTLLFYGAATRQPRWFWLAFLYKTIVDTVAAAAQFWGLETVAKIWAIEASMLILGLIGWLGMHWLHARYPINVEKVQPDSSASPVIITTMRSGK